MSLASRDHINVLCGKVVSRRAVKRNIVDLSILGYDAAVRVALDDDWFIDKGDQVAVAATRNDNGVWMSYAYRNLTKGVGGGLAQDYMRTPSILYLVIAAMLWYFTWHSLTTSGGIIIVTLPLALLMTYAGGNLFIDSVRKTSLAARQIRTLNDHLRTISA